MWRLINGVCGRGRSEVTLPPSLQTDRGVVSGDEDVMNELNRYFAGLGSRVATTSAPCSAETNEPQVKYASDVSRRPTPMRP